MITLDVVEAKSLNFEVTIGGIEPDQLAGFLRFEIAGVDYGFPANIHDTSISVDVPPLMTVVKEKMRDGLVLRGRLEVIGDGLLTNAWSGDFRIKSKIQVEAKLVSEETVVEEVAPTKGIKVKAVSEKKTKTEQVPSGDVNVDVDIEKELEQRFVEASVKPTERKVTSEDKRKKLVDSKVRGLVDSYLSESKKPVKKAPTKKVVPPKTEVTRESLTRRKTKVVENPNDQAIAYMESRGLKNKRVQESILEKAGNSDGASILEQVKVLLGDQKQEIFLPPQKE